MVTLPPTRRAAFRKALAEAIADFQRHGYDSPVRLERWVGVLRRALGSALPPFSGIEAALRLRLTSIFRRSVTQGQLLKLHPGVARFTLDRLSPMMRQELDRRILASAALIKLNRDEVIEKTLRRFSGWSTSIPAGGSKAVEKGETKDQIEAALASMPFIERRVLTDQGHKLNAALSDVLAKNSGAIAATWHSHWRQAGYDYRPDHKDRDGKFYLIRDSWAHKAGLVKAGSAGFFDDITQPGEEVYCRCTAVYVTALRGLPPEMLTEKGKAELDRVRAAIKQGVHHAA